MPTKTPSDPAAHRRPRDPRLDVFRGIGMLIILIAHVPGNAWTLWIPARFGFSDATEMFVFLSGMASAIAFGKLFDRAGFVLGTARVAQRVWQVYWAHVLVFVVVAAMMATAGEKPGGGSYVASLNLQRFFADPAALLPAFLSLRWIPNYFDILPMYLVILAMMPAMLAAERLHRLAPLALSAALWAATQARLLDLPAEPWSERTWFFNPFGWQFLFFLGFFLMRGTIRIPVTDRRVVVAAIVVLVATVPFAWYRVLELHDGLRAVADAIRPLTGKTHFGILRLVHFGALAVVALAVVGPRGERLTGPAAAVLARVGQQSLAVFISGMVLAQVLGILLDHTGRDALATAGANLAGFAVLVVVAYVVGWFKAAPWHATRPAPAAEPAPPASLRSPAR
jgi:hypothetical protein